MHRETRPDRRVLSVEPSPASRSDHSRAVARLSAVENRSPPQPTPVTKALFRPGGWRVSDNDAAVVDAASFAGPLTQSALKSSKNRWLSPAVRCEG